jgi:hypothetical protein
LFIITKPLPGSPLRPTCDQNLFLFSFPSLSGPVVSCPPLPVLLFHLPYHCRKDHPSSPFLFFSSPSCTVLSVPGPYRHRHHIRARTYVSNAEPLDFQQRTRATVVSLEAPLWQHTNARRHGLPTRIFDSEITDIEPCPPRYTHAAGR